MLRRHTTVALLQLRKLWSCERVTFVSTIAKRCIGIYITSNTTFAMPKKISSRKTIQPCFFFLFYRMSLINNGRTSKSCTIVGRWRSRETIDKPETADMEAKPWKGRADYLEGLVAGPWGVQSAKKLWHSPSAEIIHG